MRKLEEFGLLYVNGQLPPWFYKVWGIVTTVPLFKTCRRLSDEIRGIGVKNPLIREFHRNAIRQNRTVLAEYLEPQQLAMSQAGGHKLVHKVRMTLEENRHFVCVKIDLKNAHSEISRASVLEELDAEPSLRHLVTFFAVTQGAATSLENHGNIWGEAGDGQIQGDPCASAGFSVGIHRDVRALDAELAEADGCAVFGNDDGYLCGPANAVFPALDRFEASLQRRCGLYLQRMKTSVFAWEDLPAETPTELKRAGVELDGAFYPGFDCYGIAIGVDEYVRDFLEKVSEVADVVKKTCNLLQDDLQAKWTLLSSSISHMLDYHMSLQYPSDMLGPARQLDAILWQMLESAAGFPIPQVDEGMGVECCPQVNIPGLKDRTFQSWLVRLPVRAGGLGLRSLVDIIPVAFLGAVQMSLPAFGGEFGICRSLEQVVGNWQDEDRNWYTLLHSGSRTGIEFASVWDKLQTEALSCADYLGVELEGALAAGVVSVGDGVTDGSIRGKVTEERESTRAKVLSLALEQHPDQTARPVWVFPQFDKMSGAWVLALPSANTYLSGPVFRETMAWHLCLPSPSCRDLVGTPVGTEGARVDMWGEQIMCAKLPFDSWRVRHDTCKLAIVETAIKSRVECESEVYGLFRDLIPSEAMEVNGQLDSVRQRSGVVPDLRIQMLSLPANRGGTVSTRRPQRVVTDSLAELKVINAGVTRYPRGNRAKAVDRRARALPGEYRNKLSALDRQFHGTDKGQVGPLQHRFETRWPELQSLVVGQFGEVSLALHSLIEDLARARANYLSRSSGSPSSDSELSTITAQFRRFLSTTFVRSQATCLLTRLGHLGPEARSAAQRRNQWMRQEEAMRREMRAYHQAYIRGRRGKGKLAP